MAQGFVDKYGIQFPVFVDPTRESYRAMGLHRGLRIRGRLLRSAARALLAGHWQGATQGDALQQGGCLVLSAQGRVLYTHRDDTAGDHVEIERILKLCANENGSSAALRQSS